MIIFKKIPAGIAGGSSFSGIALDYWRRATLAYDDLAVFAFIAYYP